jgi:hypothetical protein
VKSEVVAATSKPGRFCPEIGMMSAGETTY